ncbi:MAG: AMP-binding protein, partial [Ruminiclostridium sp.]
MEHNNLKIEIIDFIHKKVLDILSLAEIDKNRNLIEEGLSSIMIMQISNNLRKYGLKIQFSRLIEKPTLGEWTEMIHASEIKQSKKSQGTAKVNKNSEFDLTDVQYAYFVGRDDEQPLGGVGCHAYLEMDGEHVDSGKLKTAWNTIQNYHPMLRARFLATGKQIIMPSPYTEEIGVFNLSSLSQAAAEKELIVLRNVLSHRKLKVEAGEVAGISLALLPEGKTRIFLDVDLLVADVLSLSIIIRDLSEAYAGKELIQKSEYTFHNYMENKKNDINEKELNEDKKFWENKISQLSSEIPNIPLAKKPELISKTRFSRRKSVIEKETWSEMKRISAKHKSTPSMCLLTCYALILERWCNQDTFLINIPLFNRNIENEAIRNMVADFTNLLLLDFSRKANETFLDTMNRIKGTFLENVAHSSYSGVSVQRDMFKSMGSAGFVAPIVFACNIDTPLETDLSREVFGDISYMVSQTPQVWLDFQTYIKDGSLILCWDAVDELYPDSLLDDMFNTLVDLFNTLGKNDNWNIVFDILPKKQMEQRKAELNKILPLQYPDKLLITDFLENTKKNPKNIAVINGITGEEISYSELYHKAMLIANQLVKRGVQPGDYIGIILPRGCEQIYAMLGILFSGAVYVPIGVNQPKDRRKKIYQQIGINYIVTDTKTLKNCQLADEEILTINMDDVDEKILLKKPVLISPKDSAYVIMTSGSTGVPKGVEICHDSAVNTIDDINQKYNISAIDTVLMVSAIDFDLSVYDIFGPLSAGGRLVILDETNYKDPDLWLTLLEKYNISIWNSVPMLFDMLVTMAEGKGREINIRVVMLSGDWIALDLP